MRAGPSHPDWVSHARSVILSYTNRGHRLLGTGQCARHARASDDLHAKWLVASHSRARVPMPASYGVCPYALIIVSLGRRSMRARSHTPRCMPGTNINWIDEIAVTLFFSMKLSSARGYALASARSIRAYDCPAPGNASRHHSIRAIPASQCRVAVGLILLARLILLITISMRAV